MYRQVRGGVVWYWIGFTITLGVSAFGAQDTLHTSCEIRLLHHLQSPELFGWFQQSMEELRRQRPAEVNPFATTLALEEFGVPSLDSQISMSVIGRGNGSDYRVYLRISGEAHLAAVDFPPLLVWRQFGDRDKNVLSVKDLGKDRKVKFSFGSMIISSSARKFFSLEQVSVEKFKIVLGLDVNCDEVRHYTRFSNRFYLLHAKGFYFCRVPVIISDPIYLSEMALDRAS